MDICETAPQVFPCNGPWLGTPTHPEMQHVYFLRSPEGVQWYPSQLASWRRTDLFLLAEVLQQYAAQRSD